MLSALEIRHSFQATTRGQGPNRRTPIFISMPAHCGMDISRASITALSVTATPHVLHSYICNSGRSPSLGSNRANRIGLPQLGQKGGAWLLLM